MFIDIQKNEAINLSAEDCKVFFEVLEPTLHISNQEQFCRWMQTGLQRVFPHGAMACGIGRFTKEGAKVKHILCRNFPPEYFQVLQKPDGLITSPVMAQWMITRQPVLFEPGAATAASNLQTEWLDNFHRHGLVNMTAHGQCDVDGQATSYFSFSRIPGRLTARHFYLLKLLTPHLHVVLARVVSNLPANARKHAPQPSPLTAREREVLEWLCKGKTNWEISQVMSISEATVKNHVHHILTRLRVNTRAEAVAKAINLGLVRANPRL